MLASGGGAATSAGILFEQQLGALFGARMIASQPMDPRFQLGAAEPIWIRFETEAPVDDMMIGTSAGGVVAIQAKASLSLSRDPNGPFAKTISQFVRHWLACRDGGGDVDWNRPLDPTVDRLVLAVSPRAPASIREDLPAALRGAAQPGTRASTIGQLRALADFHDCIRQAWEKISREPLPPGLNEELAHLTAVVTFDPDGADGATTEALLTTMVASPHDARAARNLLGQVCGQLMAARGGADTADLREALVTRGARLIAPPQYRIDIGTLRAHSDQVTEALGCHEVIEAERGHPINIHRDCQAAVETAAKHESLLIIGEPGSGKSGVLNALSRSLKAQGHDVLELAVDRFSVESLQGLTAELKLEHSLLDVLAAWDGPGPAWLIIDALDATRGGRSEGVFRDLIKGILSTSGRWRVIASIRTFDLRLGQQFRALFQGSPPDPTLIDANFLNVRHVRVPIWSVAEFERLLDQAPVLKAALAQASSRLRDLATVPFNTRLVSDLIADGDAATGLDAVTSQAGLLNLFWTHRIERHGYPGETCLGHIVRAMVDARTLRTPRLAAANLDPNVVEALVRDGVLVEVEGRRWIQVRHHILVD